MKKCDSIFIDQIIELASNILGYDICNCPFHTGDFNKQFKPIDDIKNNTKFLYYLNNYLIRNNNIALSIDDYKALITVIRNKSFHIYSNLIINNAKKLSEAKEIFEQSCCKYIKEFLTKHICYTYNSNDEIVNMIYNLLDAYFYAMSLYDSENSSNITVKDIIEVSKNLDVIVWIRRDYSLDFDMVYATCNDENDMKLEDLNCLKVSEITSFSVGDEASNSIDIVVMDI